MIAKAKDIRAAEKPSALRARDTPLRKRFWKEVHVKEVPEGYQIFLDARPIRSPSKSILTVPKSKPHLAHAIAIEWDLLVTAQQALKNHNIPMTSMVSRAQDMIEADERGDTRIRDDLVKVMMRYLDTDTLLCWAPEHNIHEGSHAGLDMDREEQRSGESLRSLQMKSAREIVSYLNTSIWPGVEIKEVLDEESILPQKQTEVTRSIISGWVAGLPAYELAALERATLASKSLLIATRLVVEWSEEFRHMQNSSSSRERFGIEAAAHAASIEVKWQTGMWGEVEDTHDVENEDIRRQLGSSVLLLSGAK